MPVIHIPTAPSLWAVVGLVVATAFAPGQASPAKAYLLNVSQMQSFTDIGSEDKTKPEIVEDAILGLARQ